MVEKDALNQAIQLQPASSPSPLFNAGYDVQTNGSTVNMTQAAFGSTIRPNNDLLALTPNTAAVSQPNDVTRALAQLSPDQTAELLLHTSKADIQTFIASLPQQEQQPLLTAMNGTEIAPGSGVKGISDEQVSKALAGLPHADVIRALSQIPTADLAQGWNALSTPEVTQTLKQMASNRTPGQDGHTQPTGDKTATTGGNTPADNTTDDNGWVKYAAGALLVGGGGALAWNKLKKSGAKPLAGEAKIAAKSVAPQAAEVKPVLETFTEPKAFTEGPFQGGNLTELTTYKNGSLIGKNPEGIFGPEAKAVTEGPFQGGQLTELTTMKNGTLIGKNPAGIFGPESKAFTEGPFQGAKLTELGSFQDGSLIGSNSAGMFGEGTATELRLFPTAVQMPDGPLAGASFTRMAHTPGETVKFAKDAFQIGGETVVENPAGVWNNFRGTASGTTITKLSLRPNGFISENPAGLEGLNTRTLAVKYGEPFSVEGGAFDGMKLTHFSAVPAGDGQHLVTVLNRSGLAGDAKEISKVATIGTDELQALLKGTTGTVEAYAAKAAAAKVAAAAGEVVLKGGAEQVIADAVKVVAEIPKV